MGINKKMLFGVSITVVIVIMLLYISLNQIFDRGFKSVEWMDAQKNVQRVQMAFEATVEQLNGVIIGWYQWDDTYNYLLDNSPDFIETNLKSTSYQNLNVNFVFFINKENKLVFGKGFDIETGSEMSVDDEILNLIKPDSFLLNHSSLKDVKKGLITSSKTPLIVLSAPVTNSAGDAPSAGTIVVMRYFNDKQIKQLAEVTKLNISFNYEETVSDFSVTTPQNNVLLAKQKMVDLEKLLNMVVTVSIPRHVYNEGQKTISMLLIALIVAGIVLLIVTMLITNFLVTARAKTLGNEVTGIINSLDFSRPTSLKGSDEIGKLSKLINEMIQHVHVTLEKYSK